MNKKLEMIINTLRPVGILPVICPENEAETDTFLRAAEGTAIKAVEITLRQPYAPEAIKRIKERRADFTVGAGTVLSLESLETAISAKADFCVSPGLNEEIMAKSNSAGIPFLPGCATPSDIQKAAFMGLSAVKFFPAECMGGVKALNLYKGAFNGMSFLPTGGITVENLGDYLNCTNVAACGGSFMVPKSMLKNGDSDGIREVILRCCKASKAVNI